MRLYLTTATTCPGPRQYFQLQLAKLCFRRPAGQWTCSRMQSPRYDTAPLRLGVKHVVWRGFSERGRRPIKLQDENNIPTAPLVGRALCRCCTGEPPIFHLDYKQHLTSTPLTKHRQISGSQKSSTALFKTFNQHQPNTIVEQVVTLLHHTSPICNTSSQRNYPLRLHYAMSISTSALCSALLSLGVDPDGFGRYEEASPIVVCCYAP